MTQSRNFNCRYQIDLIITVFRVVFVVLIDGCYLGMQNRVTR